MKVILQDNQRYVLRFDKDEELFASLSEFLTAQNIGASTFTAIGSSSTMELGYYNPNLKQYRNKRFLENLEIISLIGNTGMQDGKPAIHVHGMFGRTDFTTVGGHVQKLTVLATCEVHLIKLEGSMERKNNADYNLNLLV
jgi:uncharacterized protein